MPSLKSARRAKLVLEGLVRRPQVLLPMRPLFLLSHMRCYTSLLSHLLGSHAKISGYIEMHQSYKTSLSLFYARCRMVDEGMDVAGSWMLDKILHNRYLISNEIVSRRDTRFLLTVRRPRPTIASLVRMYNMVDDSGTMETAGEYYCRRLRWLEEFATCLTPGNAMFFCGEDLLSDSDELLKNISDFLDLGVPLSTTYSTFAHTGERGKGDMTDRIKACKILPATEIDDVDIPQTLMFHLEQAYDGCLRGTKHLNWKEKP